MSKLRSVILASFAVALATSAPRVAHAQTPVRFSASGALVLPVGDLGNAADPGFNLALRGEGRPSPEGWAVRGDLSWDWLGGRGPVNSYSFLGATANLVHHEKQNRLYEYGGLGLFSAHTNFVNNVSTGDADLGMQVGLGFDITSGPRPAFMEFGLNSVFTSGANSTWFPVKFGVRF